MLTADQQHLDDAHALGGLGIVDSIAGPAPARLPARDLALALHQLATLSQRIFGPSVTIESMHDPDAPDEPWIVFHVTASGDFARRREQADEWYDEAAKILPGSTTELRLSIMPRP